MFIFMGVSLRLITCIVMTLKDKTKKAIQKEFCFVKNNIDIVKSCGELTFKIILNYIFKLNNYKISNLIHQWTRDHFGTYVF